MSKETKTLLLGIGNLLMQDDGIGVHLIRLLEKEKLPKNITCIDGGVAGFETIDIMDGFDSIFVIDAVAANKKPGEFFSFSPDEIKDKSSDISRSMHGYGFLTVLKVAQSIGKEFNVKILGIQPETVNRGMELSDNLKANLNSYTKHIKEHCTSKIVYRLRGK